MSKNTTKFENGALIIERVFDAPRERLWQAWTDPELAKQWWGPKAFDMPHLRMDVRVGGTYLHCMKAREGDEVWQRGIWSTGEFKEVVPMERLVMTDSFANEEGTVVPGSHYGMEGLPLEFLVTVTFEDAGEGKTKMTLTHEGFPEDGVHGKDAGVGWGESFDKLAAVL